MLMSFRLDVSPPISTTHTPPTVAAAGSPRRDVDRLAFGDPNFRVPGAVLGRCERRCR